LIWGSPVGQDSDDVEEHILEDNEVKLSNAGMRTSLEFIHASTAPARASYQQESSDLVDPPEFFERPASPSKSPVPARPDSSAAKSPRDSALASDHPRPESRKTLLTPTLPDEPKRGSGSKSPRGSMRVHTNPEDRSKVLNMAMRHATSTQEGKRRTLQPKPSSSASAVKKDADSLEDTLHHLAGGIEERLEKQRMSYRPGSSRQSVAQP